MRFIFPSTSSAKFFPGNKTANFVTKLAKEETLIGEWEVALEEIQYPHTWYNVVEGDVWGLYTFENKTRKCVIEAGVYATGRRLMTAFHRAFKVKGLKKRATFDFDIRDERAEMTLPVGATLIFSESAKLLTGFTAQSGYRGASSRAVHRAERSPDLSGGLYSLYVYCDLVEPHIVGDVTVPLLRIVPTRGREGEMVTVAYDKAQYYPLLRKMFSTVEIDIRDDTGRPVPFQNGQVVVTLHVRPSREGSL